MTPPDRRMWLCPRCGAVNAGDLPACECSHEPESGQVANAAPPSPEVAAPGPAAGSATGPPIGPPMASLEPSDASLLLLSLGCLGVCLAVPTTTIAILLLYGAARGATWALLPGAAMVAISVLLLTPAVRRLMHRPCSLCSARTLQRPPICTPCRSRLFAERAANRDYVLGLTPLDFERHVATLFELQGYRAKVTKASGDGGVDVYLWRAGAVSIVQCKHFIASTVSRPDLQQFYGVLIHEKATEGFFVTTGRFTREARDFAVGKPIVLCDLEWLLVRPQGPG